jgi:hypothetical protein
LKLQKFIGNQTLAPGRFSAKLLVLDVVEDQNGRGKEPPPSVACVGRVLRFVA